MVSPDIDEMLERALETWQPDDPDYDDDHWVDGWLRHIKKTAATINPETAEVRCFYEAEEDPYGILGYLSWKDQGVRMYYARVPESEHKPLSRYGAFAAGYPYSARFKRPWIWFGDLPEPVRNALSEKHKKKLLGD